MRATLSRLLAVSLLVPLAAPAAQAAPGQTITSELRSLFFNGICDSIAKDDAVDCAKKPTACFLKDSEGRSFAPRTGFDYAWPFYPQSAYYALNNPAQRSGHPAPPAGAWDPLGQLSGIYFPRDVEADQHVLRVSSEQVTWFLAQIAPRPGDEICGAPAWRVYATLVKPLAHTLGDAYVYLQKKRALDNLDRKALVAERGDPAGRYEKLCGGWASEKRDESEQYARKQACEFWLRRAFVGQVKTIADAFATAVEPFDAGLAKKVRRATPKAKAERATPEKGRPFAF
ncbi:MAG: hypothetical protein EP329_28560 [Deltaproteobacteria bacterium]|nr:MAG: hypothetical protein EP329_28560 [Deltaproteobacteria bacterium]